MNIMETTPAKIVVRIEGMTIEQVRDMIEERFGALMWSPDGAAYPAEGVSIKLLFGEPAGDVARRSIGKVQPAPLLNQFLAAAKEAGVTHLALRSYAAGRDGDCIHAQCPQLRDGEPTATGRHCPLDS